MAAAVGAGRPHDSLWLRAAVFLRVNRWTDWVLVCVLYAAHGLVLRARAAPVILDKWASAWHRSWAIEASGLALGLLEDLCVCVALCSALFAFDALSTTPTAGRAIHFDGATASVRRVIASVATATSELARFAVYSAAFLLAALAPSIDHVTVRTRQVRVSSNLAALLVRERDAAVAGFQVDDDEWRLAAFTLLPTLALAVLVGLLGASWINLADWDIAAALHRLWERGFAKWKRRSSFSLSTSAYERVYRHNSEAAADDGNDEEEEEDVATVAMPSSSSSSITRTIRERDRSTKQSWRRHVSPRVLLGCAVALLFLLTLGLSRVSPSIVALIALNPTLTEPVRLVLGINYVVMHHQRRKQAKPLSELVDRESEIAEFFDSDSLYRRTLGFEGPLAFDVKLAPDERPNVLILVMESFRQRDSRYLLQAQAEQLLPRSVTLTPNFDKWAKRGVAFRNMWSTWRTSRSIETLLFGQVPYDSVSETGTTGGRVNTKLSGLPQLFKARGYETIFTTGTRADYDDWDTFLPAHGFDDLFDMNGLVEIAETEMDVDVSRGNRVMAYWGIHDDLSLGVLSHLLRGKRRRDIKAQELGEEPPTNGTAGNDTITGPPTPKPTQQTNTRPWFVTHYTISSHVPFEERPDWYFRFLKSDKAPDLRAFYEGHEHAELMKDYAEMRYFSDLVFGSFMGELKASGVLDDTIVVVVGDHGQAPERGIATPERDQVSTTRVAGAIIAEGRLGTHAGTILDDATSQADLLNTLADIVGVPDGGFVQSGIGRSLKRKPAEEFGQRPVYCNNPAGNSAVILGYLRAQYFSEVSDAVKVFDIEHDPLEQHDLLDDRANRGAELLSSRRQQLLDACDNGRALSAYFKRRWDGACLLSPTC